MTKRKFNADEGFDRLVKQEAFILDVTEAMARAIEASGLKRSEIAERLGCSKSLVTQWLSGDANLTLRSISDFADALALSPKLELLSSSDCALESVRGALISHTYHVGASNKIVTNPRPMVQYSNISQVTEEVA